MFFILDKIEQASYHSDRLQHPEAHKGAMVLYLYRNYMRTAICKVYSKKPYGEFWDQESKKKIARRHWTKEMQDFCAQKLQEAPAAPFIFRFTLLGWLFLLLVIATFGLIVYDGVKPPLPKTAAWTAMEAKPQVGDVYFGHFETYKEAGTALGAKIGFGWFKVEAIDGALYTIVKSKEMTKVWRPKAELDSVNFEDRGMDLHLLEQTGYTIRFKSPDQRTELYITDKKQ